jgi:hypothetical protein
VVAAVLKYIPGLLGGSLRLTGIGRGEKNLPWQANKHV